MTFHKADEFQLNEFLKKINFKTLNKKKILISGCNGFIGSSIIRVIFDLASKSDCKINLYGIVKKNSKIDNLVIKELIKFKKIKVFKLDIHNQINLNLKPDIIFHCASVTAPILYKKEPVDTLLTNSVGTINLFNFSKIKKTKKFLFISAGEMYGNFEKTNRKKNLIESKFGSIDPSIITSNYGISKKFGENALVCWGKKYKIKTYSARLFHTYGPLMKLGDGRIHSDLIQNVLNNQNLLIKGNYNVKRSFCYITDVVLGIILIILRGRSGESYNIANPKETLKIINLANIISKISNKRIIFKKKINLKRNNFRYPDVSINKIKKLGWKPSTNLLKGIKFTIDYFRNQNQIKLK